MLCEVLEINGEARKLKTLFRLLGIDCVQQIKLFRSQGNLHSFFNKNVVVPAQAEYSYFSADFRLKIFLHYS